MKNNSFSQFLKFFLGVLVFLISSNLVAQDYAFYTKYYDVNRTNLDGTASLAIVPDDGVHQPMFMCVDPVNQKIYYYDSTASSIIMCNYDGSAKSTIITSVSVQGIAVHPSAGKIYYSLSDYTIKSAGLNGAGIQTVVPDDGVGSPKDITVDVVNDKLYYSDNAHAELRSCNLDGSSIIPVVLGNIDGIAVDPVGGKVYYIMNYNVYRANLNGSSSQIIIPDDGVGSPQRIALDLVNNKLLYTDIFHNQIRKSNLDGSGLTSILSAVQLKDVATTNELTVVPLNNAPIATPPSSPVVIEDATNIALANDIQISDADGDSQTVSFTVTGGTVTIGTTGITFGGSGNGSASFTATGLLADINIALDAATFTPTPNLNGTNAGTITIISNDGTDNSNSASVSFNIIGSNDLPTISAPSAPTVVEDDMFVALADNINVDDIDGDNQTVTISITGGVVTVGTTSITFGGGGNGSSNFTVQGTLANVNIALDAATFTPTPNLNGVNVATIQLTTHDGTVSSGSSSVTFSISAVNDVPTFTVFSDNVETTTQNTEVEITLSELKAFGNEADVDGTVDAFVVQAISSGTLNIGASSASAIAYNATTNNTINALNNAYWTPALSAYGSSINAFTVIVEDNNSAVSIPVVQATVQVNDVTNPEVSSVTISGTPAENATSVSFIVAFSELVLNVSTDDFSLTTTGTAVGSINSVSSSTGTSITVEVISISGTGSLRLDLDAATNITDLSVNTLPAAYSSGAIHIVDRDNPMFSSSLPIDENTGVNANANITLTFNEIIYFGTGNIQIVDLDDGSSTITIDAASPGTQAIISTNTLTINPTNDLEENVNYAVQISATAIDDQYGNSYAGILDNTTLNFMTADITSPILTSSNPVDNSNNAILGEDITLTFDDNMLAGIGNITLKYMSDDTAFEVIPIGDPRVSIISNQVSINPNAILSKGLEYYIEIDATALDDDAGNSFAGMSGNSILNFTAVDVVINEIVTDPQQDWSTTGFDGTISAGVISQGTDEWIELLVNSDNVDLSGWTIELIDGTDVIGDLTNTGAFDVSLYSSAGSGTFSTTEAGDYLVLGNVDLTGAMNNTGLVIKLKDPSGGVVDSVKIGGGSNEAPSGNAISIYNETLQRFSNGLDTNTDDSDFTKGQASIGVPNTGPSVSIAASASSIVEASGTSIITATLSAASSQNITVNLAISGTATESGVGDDYNISTTSIVINAGLITGTATITSIHDTKLEADETIIVDVLSVTNSIEAGIQQQTVTITNDDAAAVTIANVSGDENSGAITVTATLDNAVQGGFTVDVSTSNGTATTSDSDYSAVISQTLTFSGTAGETATFTITPTGDTKLEANETLTISQSNLAATTLGVVITDGATVTITNDDAAAVTIANVSGDENSGAITVTATLDNPVQGGFTVDVSTSDGTATTSDSDYSAVISQTLTFSGTAGETATFTITPTGDTKLEANETLTISQSNLAATTLGVVITDGATVTITNDDAAAVTIANVSGDENSGAITVTATLDNPVQGGFTVDVSTSDGTATTSDSDYSAVISQTLTFSGTAGETATFTITPTGDTKLEANETLTISQSNLAATTLGVVITDGATVTITNDDAAVVSIANVSGDENSGAITVTATLDNPVQGGFTVDVSTSDGTATTADSDYSAVISQTLTFSGTAGETATFTITPTGDTKLEANETLTISQSNLAATTLGVVITDGATVTITNDDAAAVTIANVSGDENSGAITATATLDNAVQGGFTVDVSTSNGTATTSDSDYSAVISQTLTFSGTAGETATFTITPTGDTKLEADETLTISQSNLAATTLGVVITDGATVTITNDDAAPTIAFNSTNSTALEAVSSANLQVDLSNLSGFDVTVDYVVSGTATAADYTLANGTLTISTGNSNNTITIASIVDDLLDETNETVIVTLSNPSNATLGANSEHTYTINDNDVMPSVTFSTSSQTSVNESGTITITAVLSALSGRDVTVPFTVNGLSTASGSNLDYSIESSPLVILTGVLSNDITITIQEEYIVETDETVVVNMGVPNSATQGIITTHTVTIADDDVLPTVLTTAITTIDTNAVSMGGNITDAGSSSVTDRGVVFSSTDNTPTIGEAGVTKDANGIGVGVFDESIALLIPGTTYYVQAYVTTAVGTIYGGVQSFTTLKLPILTTQAVSSINTTSAIANANVIDLGVPNPTQYGVVWSTSVNPTVSLSTKSEEGALSTTGAFNFSMTDLVPNTTYYVRAYATNAVGTSYGNEVSFTTDVLQLTISAPTVTAVKMYDGLTTAVVNAGVLSGVVSSDIGNVTLNASANYNDATVGDGKTISVVYTLSGSAANNYFAPATEIITAAKILDEVKLENEKIELASSGGCQGNNLYVAYKLLSGEAKEYKITFDAQAVSAGFIDVSYSTLLSSLGNDTVYIPVPAAMKEGVYNAQIIFRNEIGLESKAYAFSYTINLSKDYLVAKFNDVIVCDNSSNRFVSYQWYKDGSVVSGATGQFYNDPNGVVGNYYLQVVTKEGESLRTCSQELDRTAFRSATVSVYPNPVRTSETFTVEITDLTTEELAGAILNIYAVQGALVYSLDEVELINKIQLPAGEYVGAVNTADGMQYSYKLIVIN